MAEVREGWETQPFAFQGFVYSKRKDLDPNVYGYLRKDAPVSDLYRGYVWQSNADGYRGKWFAEANYVHNAYCDTLEEALDWVEERLKDEG